MNDLTPRPYRRSHKPIFWSLFGAGGMLSALTGPAIVLVFLLLMPLGLLGTGALDHARVLRFATSWLGIALAFGLITLYLFHAFHRFYHTLHDFGVDVGPGIKAACHTAAGLFSALGAYLLWRL